MKLFKHTGLVVLAIVLLSAGCNKTGVILNQNKTDVVDPLGSGVSDNSEYSPPAQPKEVTAPISHAQERVTKKPFGIYITPKTSPVQPEKFTGFHSGTDFEIFPEEKDADVPINAICAGKLANKRTATGYGGVVTQYCTIDNQAVTVIYGHMRLASVKANNGDVLKQGDDIGVLGTGYSAETSGERKHLHLGIVKGQGSDIRGYVQQQSQLSDFLDVMKYL